MNKMKNLSPLKRSSGDTQDRTSVRSKLSSSLYCPTFRPPLSGWLAALLEKYWSREERQNRPLLENRASECDRVQILRAQLRRREEKLKYLALYFSSSGTRGAFITIF